MDKNVIWALNKQYTSYNPASIHYINDNFKDMMLKDASQEKALIHQ